MRTPPLYITALFGLLGCQSSQEAELPPATAMQLAPTARYSIPDVSEGYALTRLRHVRVKSGPVVGLADVAEILVFDSPGQPPRHIGQPGEGPGEFRDVSAWVWCAGDTLIAYDRNLARISLFDADRVANQMSVRDIGGLTQPPVPVACGRRLFATVPGESGTPAGFPDGTSQRSIAILAGPVDHSRFDTVAMVQGSMVYRGLGQPLGATTVLSESGGGLVFGYTADSVLHRLRDDGGRDSVVLRGLRIAKPVTEAMRLARYEYSREATPPGIWVQELKDIYDAVPWPTTLPRWEGLLVDSEGRFWLSEYIAVHQEDYAARLWQVFSRDGILAGELSLPRGKELVGVTDGIAWVITTDTDDARTIEGYELK